MVDRTAEDIAQDKRISALERAPKPKASMTASAAADARLDALEAKVAELEAKLAPFDNIAKFIAELRFRGHLPNLVGF